VRVFVAGATGALGTPVVRLLREAGHDVTGLTRSERKRSMLESIGATCAVADALDQQAVRRAIVDARPEAILSLLTRLPKRGPLFGRDLQANARVHRNGTANVVHAAKEARIQRIVAESVIFRYGWGDIPPMRTEDDPAATSAPSNSTQMALDGVRALEETVLAAGGVVLRFAAFYGPGVGHVEFMTKLLRRRFLPVPDVEGGSLSWIHIEDAASATVAALDRGRPSQVYNIADDEPIGLIDFTRELARAIGAPEPRKIPLAFAKATASYGALLATSTMSVSNAKAKRELGWAPRYPSIREGLPTMIARAGPLRAS
jgi:nucleoside-diphosphate-sugar epimerase